MPDKILFGCLSLFFVTAAGGLYLHSILSGRTKPHLFTWIIWTVAAGIAAAAQYAGGAGPGAWATGVGFLIYLSTMFLCLKSGERTVTRGDWVALCVGLSAIPIWYFTADPFTAVFLASCVDGAAYYPTFRKSYAKPEEEAVFSYVVGSMQYLTSLFAIKTYSPTTLFYPVAILVMNSGLIGLVTWRRGVTRRTAS